MPARRTLALVLAGTLALVACGGGGDDDSDDAAESTTTEAEGPPEAATLTEWVDRWRGAFSEYANIAAGNAKPLDFGLAASNQNPGLAAQTASRLADEGDELGEAIRAAGAPPQGSDVDVEALLAVQARDTAALRDVASRCQAAAGYGPCNVAVEEWAGGVNAELTDLVFPLVEA